MTEHAYAVVLAGGIGSRFWPLSRLERPKQFLKVFGEQSLIEDTVHRLRHRFQPENILIITNQLHEERTRRLFPRLPPRNIIGEPLGRNTAACIGLAALLLRARDPDSSMIVLPADHYIGDREEFLCTLERALQTCRNQHLVTLGIQPTSPETGFGYIQFQPEEIEPGVYPVKTFAEKPDLKTARLFLQSGDFLWNSGIFIWETRTIVEALERWLPETWETLEELSTQLDSPDFGRHLAHCYRQLRSISIDIGVMEPASQTPGAIRVIQSSFPWNDVGTWAEVHRMREKDGGDNVVVGDAVVVDSNRCLVHAPDRVVALVGMRDTIVVDSDDALLVCRMDAHQDVRHVIARLKEDGLHELL